MKNVITKNKCKHWFKFSRELSGYLLQGKLDNIPQYRTVGICIKCGFTDLK